MFTKINETSSLTSFYANLSWLFLGDCIVLKGGFATDDDIERVLLSNLCVINESMTALDEVKYYYGSIRKFLDSEPTMFSVSKRNDAIDGFVAELKPINDSFETKHSF